MGKPMLGSVVVSGYKRQNVGRFEGVKVEVPTVFVVQKTERNFLQKCVIFCVFSVFFGVSNWRARCATGTSAIALSTVGKLVKGAFQRC